MLDPAERRKGDIPSWNVADRWRTYAPVVTVKPKAVSPDTLRKRRLRQRQRDGKAMLMTEVVYNDLVEAMIVSKRLSESEALDRRAVEADASIVLAQWIAEVFERVGRR